MIRSFLFTILFLVLFPIYSALFISIHELGHVAVMRLSGDEEAWFYLVKVDENSRCLGCTTSSGVELPWAGEVLLSLGGLIITQTIALTALLLLSLRPRRRWIVITLSVIALTFAFFDILAQVPQGLYYNLDSMTYKTSVDLVDVMLLIQMKVDAGQDLLKGLLLGTAVLYLIGFVWFFRRSRRSLKNVPKVAGQDLDYSEENLRDYMSSSGALCRRISTGTSLLLPELIHMAMKILLSQGALAQDDMVITYIHICEDAG